MRLRCRCTYSCSSCELPCVRLFCFRVFCSLCFFFSCFFFLSLLLWRGENRGRMLFDFRRLLPFLLLLLFRIRSIISYVMSDELRPLKRVALKPSEQNRQAISKAKDPIKTESALRCVLSPSALGSWKAVEEKCSLCTHARTHDCAVSECVTVRMPLREISAQKKIRKTSEDQRLLLGAATPR